MTLLLSIDFRKQTDGRNGFIFCVCVFSCVYMCGLYMYMSEIINVFFVNILPCQVHFYSLGVTLLSLSLRFNMKGESVIHTHTHKYMCAGWSPLKSALSLVEVQCDSKVTKGQISSMQFILSQKQTAASDPPTALASDLMFLGLSLSPLAPFFFLSL